MHIPYCEGKSLTGTARYASVYAHIGIEQSRRDDLEAIGFVLMYFLRGSLPWQGIQTKNKKEKYDKIKQTKVSTSFDSLCTGFPEEFLSYLNYCHKLAFEDKPDYSYLTQLFRNLYLHNGLDYDFIYDWILLKNNAKGHMSSLSFSKPPVKLGKKITDNFIEETKKQVKEEEIKVQPIDPLKENVQYTRPPPQKIAFNPTVPIKQSLKMAGQILSGKTDFCIAKKAMAIPISHM